MSIKGEQTRKWILEKAYELFVEKGFKAVTMKDICEATELSRGGLYRHYDSTEAIFREIFKSLSSDSIEEINVKIEKGEPADDILETFLVQLQDEMLDAEHSLSLAIYEYAHDVDAAFFEQLNEVGREKWRSLLQYGIETKVFKKVDIEQVIDLIVYAYQGVRMWSRVIPIGEETASRMIKTIEELVLREQKAR